MGGKAGGFGVSWRCAAQPQKPSAMAELALRGAARKDLRGSVSGLATQRCGGRWIWVESTQSGLVARHLGQHLHGCRAAPHVAGFHRAAQRQHAGRVVTDQRVQGFQLWQRELGQV